MSTLSREIARWIQTNPGRIEGDTEDAVWLLAKLLFIKDRRWRGEFDTTLFMQYVTAIGYTTTTVKNHGDKSQYFALALPERHKGF